MDTTSPTKLLAILNELECLREPRATGHLRRHRRFCVRGGAQLHSMDRGILDRQPVDVFLRDVSLGGVGFVCGQELPEKSLWGIAFETQGWPTTHQSLMVCHCRQIQCGVFLVGTQVCFAASMLCMLGIDPRAIDEGDQLDLTAEANQYSPP